MSSTLQELESFTRFAQQQLSMSASNLSLEECVRLWRQQTEQQETIADLKQGQADVAAGLAQPLAEAFHDVRRRLGLAAYAQRGKRPLPKGMGKYNSGCSDVSANARHLIRQAVKEGQ